MFFKLYKNKTPSKVHAVLYYELLLLLYKAVHFNQQKQKTFNQWVTVGYLVTVISKTLPYMEWI